MPATAPCPPAVATGTWRQQVLCLWLANSDLASPGIAWSRYDGASPPAPRLTEDQPPYADAVAAMRDGWRVLQMTLPTSRCGGDPYDTDYLPHGIILERFVETAP